MITIRVIGDHAPLGAVPMRMRIIIVLDAGAAMYTDTLHDHTGHTHKHHYTDYKKFIIIACM